jgi:hypothetical protein
MGQIDYFFRWANEAAANADATLLSNKFNLGNIWSLDCVLPNVLAWRPSQDVGGVHTYLTTWHAIVSWPKPISVLLNASALAFALDRDAAKLGQPFVIQNNIGAVILDIAVSPIFAGSNYPIGGYNTKPQTNGAATFTGASKLGAHYS